MFHYLVPMEVWLDTPIRSCMLINLYTRANMTEASTLFDVIVVGAGVEGSATAYQLIKNGAKKVLLLEQVRTVRYS